MKTEYTYEIITNISLHIFGWIYEIEVFKVFSDGKKEEVSCHSTLNLDKHYYKIDEYRSKYLIS